MSQARLTALRLLNRRDYTAAELRTKLLDKDHAPDQVAEALDGLIADGLVDDHRVAAAFVRVAATVKGRGRLRIARELEARGVAKSIVADALSRLPVEDEEAAIRRFLARKRLPTRLPAADHRRIFGQLLRRGFTADAIATVIREPRDDT